MSHGTQLWHGSDDIRDECLSGFDNAYTNSENSVYGASFYFSFDLRLARYFENSIALSGMYEPSAKEHFSPKVS